MENTPMSLEEQLAEAKAQLAASVAEKEAALAAAAAAEATAKKALKEVKDTQLGKVKIKGSYEGYRFDDNHKLVRDREGKLCDTEMLLAAAAGKDAEAKATAVAVLDWLIEIQYAHFTKG